MKRLALVSLAAILVCESCLIASPVGAFDEPTVGVKEGDWMEYDVIITGTGSMPPTHDVTWMRLEVFEVQGTVFSVNFTTRYANGTVGSAIWPYNFTEGELGGWTVIPANLSLGETFYDLARHTEEPVNVTVEREEQKNVLGAIRTVTYGSDSIRHIKEWDKTTGMFLGSVEPIKNKTTKTGWYIEDLIVTTKAIATNMWSPQILGIDQKIFYGLVTIIVVLSVFASSAIIILIRKRRN